MAAYKMQSMSISTNGKDWIPVHGMQVSMKIDAPNTLPFEIPPLPKIKIETRMTRRDMQRAIRFFGGHHGMRREKRRARKRRGK